MLVLVLLAAATQAGGLSWKPPASWPVEARSSTMRVATHRIPPAAGDPEPGELAIFFFGPESGSVKANVERWLNQFAPEPGSPESASRVEMVKGIRVTRVSTEGTYASGMPGQPAAPKHGFALLGAIAEGPAGNVFFKVTGPRKTVQRAAPQFDALLRTLARQ